MCLTDFFRFEGTDSQSGKITELSHGNPWFHVVANAPAIATRGYEILREVPRSIFSELHANCNLGVLLQLSN